MEVIDAAHAIAQNHLAKKSPPESGGLFTHILLRSGS
jgi:hypothetical protein